MFVHTTLGTCPFQTFAWIQLNHDESIITSASPQVPELLGFDPVHESIHVLWQSMMNNQNKDNARHQHAAYHVSTIHRKTLKPMRLCLCPHSDDNTMTIGEVSNLEGMQESNRTQEEFMITRLSPYGTIEILYSTSNSEYHTGIVGKPIMRFVHSDDVIRLCRALHQATQSTVASVNVRYHFTSEKHVVPSHLSIFSTKGGLICVIQPTSEAALYTNSIGISEWPQCARRYKIIEQLCILIGETQQRLWQAVGSSFESVTQAIAVAVVTLVQTLCQNLQKASEQSCLESLVRLVANEAKARPEVGRFFGFLDWAGIVQSSTSHNFLDTLLDCGTEWLIARSIPPSDPVFLV